MDLLPFQAGSDASNEEETDYLNVILNGELIDGVQLETPEADDDTDDRPGQVHSTTETYKAHSAAAHLDSNVCALEPNEGNPQLPAIETSCDTREVLLAPEIEFEFGDEPIIELSSYY